MTNAVTMYGASNESVVVYQSEDGTLKLNVQLKEESVWLTQEQIATLFGTQRPAITKHLNNIFNSGELDRTSTCSILERRSVFYPIKFNNFKPFFLPPFV